MFRIAGIRKQILFAGLAFAAIAMLFGMWSQHNINDKVPNKLLALKNGTAFPDPKQLQNFQLKDAATGKVLSNAQLQGHWSMLFFGFTHCAMLCPTTLSSLNQTYLSLQDTHEKNLPQVLFISIDPERDSLQRIHKYVTGFNKNFSGATGTKQQLDDLTKSLNILYLKVDPNKDNNYQIDHSGTVVLIDPKGRLAALFSPPIDPKILAEDYQAVTKQFKEE